MEESKKLSISIWGSCVSRNIFNYPYINEIFNVESYIWQMPPHTAFGESINFPEEEIDKIQASQYEKRMLKNEFNKGSVAEFVSHSKGGYCLIDLMTLASDEIQVTYKGRTSIINSWRGANWCKYFKEVVKLDEFDYTLVDNHSEAAQKDYDDRVKEGIVKFAETVKNLFEAKNIIIYVPECADYYLDKDLHLKSYDESAKKWHVEVNNKIRKYSEYIIQNIPGCKIMNPVKNLIAYDSIVFDGQIPHASHFTVENYVAQGNLLLDVLDIDIDKILPSEKKVSPFTKIYYNLIKKSR